MTIFHWKKNLFSFEFRSTDEFLHFWSLWQKICSFSLSSSLACFIHILTVNARFNRPEKSRALTMDASLIPSKDIQLACGDVWYESESLEIKTYSRLTGTKTTERNSFSLSLQLIIVPSHTTLLGIARAINAIIIQCHCADNLIDNTCFFTCLYMNCIEDMHMIGLDG